MPKPIIDKISFTVAFNTEHEGAIRRDLITKALREYSDYIDAQVTMANLADISPWAKGVVKTCHNHKNAFEASNGVLVWWEAAK